MAAVSCAGDSELAKKLHDYLASRFPSAPISLEEDEITIQLDNGEIQKSLEEFVGSNPDLAGYSVIGSGDIFTVGIRQSLDKVILQCEMCGYLAKDEDEMMIHRRLHGYLYGLG